MFVKSFIITNQENIRLVQIEKSKPKSKPLKFSYIDVHINLKKKSKGKIFHFISIFIFVAAKKYMVTGLIQACVNCLEHFELNDGNVLCVLGQARLHDEKVHLIY